MIVNNRLHGAALGGLAMLLLGMWLVATPYYGIRHDSILYTAQALFRLNPEVFGHDLFFRFGSQDSFTLFPLLHAWLIQGIGIDAAALSLTLLGKACWFAGLLWFSSAFLAGAGRWIGLALVVSYTPFFDSWKVFSYGESFATARIFAEALVLFALGFLLRSRPVFGVAGLVLAMMFHPLVAIPGVAAGLLLHQWKSIAVLMAAFLGLAGVVLSLAILGLEPFSRLLVTFDPEWLRIIEQRNPYVFMDVWGLHALGRLAFLGVVLGVAQRSRSPAPARLAEIILLLGATTLVVSWLGASLLHNVLITQLQLWRALWLIQLSALLLLGGISPELWRAGGTQRLFLVVLWSATLLEDGITVGLLAVFGFVGTAIVQRYSPSWRPTKAIWVVAALLFCFALFGHAISVSFSMATWAVYFDRPRWQVVLSDVVPVVGVTALVTHATMTKGHFGRNASLVTGMLAIVAGVFAWHDAATHTWGRETHVGVAGAQALQERIPDEATVYWPDHHEAAWFWLRRAHYVSGIQTAGILFSRQTAVEASRRQKRLQALQFREGNPYWAWDVGIGRGETNSTKFSLIVVQELCEDPVLDYVIFPNGMSLASVMTFVDPVGKTEQALIDCRALRVATSRLVR